MAISIDWPNGIINIPKGDLVLVQASPTEIRELDLDAFRLTLKDLEDDIAGMAWPRTHRHNTAVTVGGVTLARVIEIINGYTITFEDGQYAVNLIGANSNVGDRVNVNQVSVRAANSAGLVQVREIENSAYGGVINVDAVNGVTGTGYPIGTHAKPVNNVIDAMNIGLLRGIEVFIIHGEYTLITGDDMPDVVIKGENAISTSITIESGANVHGTQFQDMFLSDSVFDGMSYINHCGINNISGVEGYIESCILSYNIKLSGTGNTFIIDSKSACVGLSAEAPVIDFDFGERHIALRNWSGPISFINSDNADSTACIDIVSGATITIDSSVSAGEFIIRGSGVIVDNSTGTAIVIDQTTEIGVWNKSISDMITPNSIGEWVSKKVLTIKKFIGLK